jgi:hypothetical protein
VGTVTLNFECSMHQDEDIYPLEFEYFAWFGYFDRNGLSLSFNLTPTTGANPSNT